MKKQTFLKSMLCLLMALVCNVAWAQPTVGKYYKLKNLHDGSFVYDNADGGNRLTAISGTDTSIDEEYKTWYLESADTEGKYTLRNKKTNGYITPGGEWKTAQTKAEFYLVVRTPATSDAPDYYNLSSDANASGSTCLHCWIGTPGKNWSGDGGGSQYAFIEVVPTFTLQYLKSDNGAFWNADENITETCPTEVKALRDNESHAVRGASTDIIMGAEGDITVTFQHNGGNHAMKILGIDVVNASDEVVKYDYHFGSTGNSNSENEYKLEAVPAGNYTLRFFVDDDMGNDHNIKQAQGTITIVGAAKNTTSADAVAAAKATAIAHVEANANKLGTALGYFSYTADDTKLHDVEAAKAAINAGNDADVIKAIIESFAVNTPEVGKYYRIKGISGNYIDAVNCYSGDQMGMKSAEECNYLGTIFLLDEGNRLKNMATDTYVYGTRHIGKAKNDANTWTFAASTRTLGCLTLTANGNSSHQLHDNAGNRADRCGSICGERHDFTIEEVQVRSLTVDGPAYVGASATWNGETKALPATWAIFNGITISNPALTINCPSSYTFTGLTENGSTLGNTVNVESLTADRTITANFNLALFSASTNEKDLVPVRIRSARNNTYTLRLNANDSYSGKAVNSGVTAYGENEIWYLVGTEQSFKIYNRVAGTGLHIVLSGTGQESAASMNTTTDNADFCLVAKNNGYAICPKSNTGQSFNMFGGTGADIKLYGAGDGGSIWTIEKMDVTKPLTLNVEVDQVWESSPRVAELTLTIDGLAGQTRILGDVEGQKLYIPAGAAYEVSSMTYRGYTYNGCTDNAGVLTASYTANDERTLFYSPRDGHPYRIPAIATAANGDVFAICDYRPCGNDIGYGEVDLVCRVSSDNGVTWTEEKMIADGKGDAYAANDTSKIWQVGFGDPAIVADRETNKVLVMSVCGNQTCWDGTFGEPNPNPNRVARLYITYDEEKKEWVYGEPEEVTYSIYPKFVDKNGNVHAASLFIGAGKICQSRVVKKKDYYRLYCAVWNVTKTQRQHHNYVIYSDDFGQTWEVLGDLGYENSASKWGNEPKCEELPDGTVVLSSRKYNGRYFNLFKFDNDTYTTGSWLGEVGSNDVQGGLSFGGNSTNGEIYKVKAIRKSDKEVCDLMFQSIPTGNDRSNVAIYYKEMEYNEDGTNLYTSTTFAQGWTKGKHVSTKESCYSTMILQADGRIGFFFEEVPGGYCMVYIPYTIEELTGDEYTLCTEEEGDGDTTSLEVSEIGNQKSEMVFDLMGRRVEKMEKGIYIVGGRKVIK